MLSIYSGVHVSKFTVRLSSEINKRFTEIATRDGISKSEAIRRAMALFSIAEKEKEKGHSLGILRENPDNHEIEIVGRFVGL